MRRMSNDARPRSLLRPAILGVLGVLLVLLLFRLVPDVDVGATLARTDLGWLLGAFVAYAASYALRALRFRLLIHSARPPLHDLAAVVCVHNLLNMLLPLKSGELSYVYLARKRYGVSLGEGAATLVLARLYDLLGIGAWLLTAILVTRLAGGDGGGEATERFIAAGAALTAVSLVTIVGLAPLVRKIAGWIEALARRSSRPLPRSLAEKARALVHHVESIRARRTAPLVLACTQIQWLMTFVTCFAVLRAGGVTFPFLRSVLGSTGLSVALILPINPIGGIGTFEAGWTFGYVLAGLDRSLALATAVSAHLFILGFAALLGAAGALRLRGTPATVAT